MTSPNKTQPVGNRDLNEAYDRYIKSRPTAPAPGERTPAEHTPGPWKAYFDKQGDCTGVKTANGKLRICWLDFWGEQIETGNIKSEEEMQANARLIAAAPATKAQRDELLELVQHVLNCSEDDGGMELINWDALRAAIARASETKD